ncbi:hypothetical protein chiPu_0019705 [Chiloscyllium punctatum]|uniref:Uncharacterized protein n=1 Tax=Chiloscyllium punctatum TaxID=137246 RepID=A0A401RSY2_CHIPU|nr:hypothetical protein [Chiloscyllium punctatum]
MDQSADLFQSTSSHAKEGPSCDWWPLLTDGAVCQPIPTFVPRPFPGGGGWCACVGPTRKPIGEKEWAVKDRSIDNQIPDAGAVIVKTVGLRQLAQAQCW